MASSVSSCFCHVSPSSCVGVTSLAGGHIDIERVQEHEMLGTKSVQQVADFGNLVFTGLPVSPSPGNRT